MPSLHITGKVVSKTDKTISVQVVRSKNHPLYRKRYTVSKKFFAHDPENKAGKGDLVELKEIPPVSRTKRWELVSVVEKNLDPNEVVG